MLISTVATRLRAAALAAAALAAPALGEGAPLGDDGLHKPDWLHETFLDLGEDLAEATAEGKRMVIFVEQLGCIYCKKMHEEILPDPRIDAIIRESFYPIQINLYGDLEVTDLDGNVMSEKDMTRHWNVIFTPTVIFLPEAVDGSKTAVEDAVAVMPGAFERNTTLAMFTWIRDKAYETEPNFQRFFADNFEMDPSN
ncbi:MAG: thioredoxin family protein [Maritimibacter sp.]|nr:thioredoxin family protein [Maritimibacter sp.]